MGDIQPTRGADLGEVHVDAERDVVRMSMKHNPDHIHKVDLQGLFGASLRLGHDEVSEVVGPIPLHRFMLSDFGVLRFCFAWYIGFTMKRDEIQKLLENLEFQDGEWFAPLPDSVQFLGRPTTVQFETYPIPKPDNRRPNEVELALATQVLEHIEELMPKIEAMFVEYHSGGSEAMIETASEPQVRISTDSIELDGPERWLFSVSSTMNEFMTLVICDGLEVLEATGD